MSHYDAAIRTFVKAEYRDGKVVKSYVRPCEHIGLIDLGWVLQKLAPQIGYGPIGHGPAYQPDYEQIARVISELKEGKEPVYEYGPVTKVTISIEARVF